MIHHLEEGQGSLESSPGGSCPVQKQSRLTIAIAADILTIAYLNIRGQSGLNKVIQLQIEFFTKTFDCDIVNLQKVHVESETYSSCDFIQSSFTIIENNSQTKYGTASLVKATLLFENIRNDLEG